MTLTEAIRSGRKFSRPNLMEDFGYFTSEEIGDDVVLSADDIVATDYVLEPAGKTVTTADLISAWNAARVGTTSVKSATESAFFAKMNAHLFGGG